MTTLTLAALALSCALAVATFAEDTNTDSPATPAALDFTMDSITGEPVELSQYHGKVVLFVNVASKCGKTKHYKGLQKLYEDHADDGLVILGFPCNQFGGQEPGTAEQIVQFCEKNYGVTFPLFEKINVNGDEAAPLYQYLTSELPTIEDHGKIKWNFEKFLVNREGVVTHRFRSGVAPEAEEFTGAISAALAE